MEDLIFAMQNFNMNDQPANVANPMDALLRRIPPPVHFSGDNESQNVEAWLFSVEQFFLLCNVGNLQNVQQKKAIFVGTLLSGKASVWYRNYVNTLGNMDNLSFNNLKTALLARFKMHNELEDARTQLDSLKQSGPVKDYVSTFEELLMKVTDLSVAAKVHRFLSGLNANIRVGVRSGMVKKPENRLTEEDLATTISLALAVESCAADQGFVSNGSTPTANPNVSVEPMELGAIQRRTHGNRPIKREFDGVCLGCGRYGHKKSDCYAPKE